jgi:hypothetical protein
MAVSADDAVFRHYVQDLGSLVNKEALRAKRDYDAAKSDLALGRLMAWHEIVSLMELQAIAFEINKDDLGLRDIDADRDLL